jgi:hypothetical protein
LKPRLILLPLACALFLGLAVPPAKANTRVLSAPGHPIFLVLKEESGVVTQAILRTPGALQPITEIVGLSFAGENTSTLAVDRDAKPDLLWKLTFLDQKERSQGTILWISALTRQPRVWLAVSPVAETLWDAIRPKLTVPRGTLLYISPILPSFFNLLQYQGKDVLTYVYCLTIDQTGPGIGVVPEVYKQLLRIVQTVREHEFDAGRRKAYEALEADFKTLSEGGKPSTEAILNFGFRKIAEFSWLP